MYVSSNELNKDFRKSIKQLRKFEKRANKKNIDLSPISDNVVSILTIMNISYGKYLKHFSIQYESIPTVCVKIWAWQLDESLPVTLNRFTNILLITVEHNSINIKYFDLKPNTIYKWWDYKSIIKASDEDVNNAINWITTTPSQYTDCNVNIPYMTRIINTIKLTVYQKIGWLLY